MNPLDVEELQVFLKIIKKDMPLHTDTMVKVKTTQYGRFEKNLMYYSEKIDNEFLNDNLHVIEEMEYRKKGITNNFKNYQNKYYNESGILNHDLYFEHENKIYSKVKGSGVLINPYSFGVVFGAELTTGDTSSHSQFWNAQTFAFPLSSGVIGDYYNRIAVNVFSATSGNMRVGLYDNSGSSPSNLIVESSSVSVTAGFNWNGVTQFQITTAANWAGLQVDTFTPDLYFLAGGGRKYLTRAYSAFQTPYGTPTASDTGQVNMKVGGA